jgi:murein DD-endopeptidase MepM/ murein hydrolase activator NlpD
VPGRRLSRALTILQGTGRAVRLTCGVSCALCLSAPVATAQPLEDPAPFASTSALPPSFLHDLQLVDRASRTALGVVTHVQEAILPMLPEVRAAIDNAILDSTTVVGDALSSVAGFRAIEPSIWSHQGQVLWPIPNGTLAAPFGERRRENSATLERHTGWSLQATASSVVQSVAQGVVVFAEPVDGLGFTVVVAHAGDLHTVYAGLLSLTVQAWQPVAAGETLGLGAAESASGRRELYFEVRESGVPVDPALWLR